MSQDSSGSCEWEGETVTFSSVTKPVAEVSLTPAPERRNKPFKVKKEKKRKKPCLQKRRQGKYLPLKMHGWRREGRGNLPLKMPGWRREGRRNIYP